MTSLVYCIIQLKLFEFLKLGTVYDDFEVCVIALNIILLFLFSVLSFKRCIAVTDYINFEKSSKKKLHLKTHSLLKHHQKALHIWITNYPYSRLVEPPDAFWEKSNNNFLTGVEVDNIFYT